MTETCGRCGRRLKNPVFREIGYGRTCAAKVGQVVKALVLLGARKIIVEEVEKDRFVVTTTTEAAHSKKA